MWIVKNLTLWACVCWPDIAQILLEAKTRWLRPSEICEILRNYQRFNLTTDPPYKPPGMHVSDCWSTVSSIYQYNHVSLRFVTLSFSFDLLLMVLAYYLWLAVSGMHCNHNQQALHHASFQKPVCCELEFSQFTCHDFCSGLLGRLLS